jgi:hypothetical protein
LNAGRIGGVETGVFSARSDCRLYGDLPLCYVAKARDREQQCEQHQGDQHELDCSRATLIPEEIVVGHG